jgi:glucose-1-phosphate cytidylyltransferase
MVTIGYRPILWNVMRYYAHYGHKDFILCLGYKADVVKNYFLNYKESASNDFVLTEGGTKVQLLSSDIVDWRITFVNTGLNSNIGQRLKAVEKFLDGEEMFLANYSDGLSDLPLDDEIAYFKRHDKIGCFVSIPPTGSFHQVITAEDGMVKSIQSVTNSGMRVNGGFFVFKRAIFDHIKAGEELVRQPFQRLISEKQLVAYPHNGFWACMDTFKDYLMFEDMYARGEVPWEVWRKVPGDI